PAKVHRPRPSSVSPWQSRSNACRTTSGGTWVFHRSGDQAWSESVHSAVLADSLSLLANTRRLTMLSISRFSASNRLAIESVGEALLNFGFLRAGLSRGRTEDLSDHLRRDLGL